MRNILLGKTEFGKEIVLDTEKFLKSRLLFQGISGSWKTETIKTIVRGLKEVTRTDDHPNGIPQIIFDWEGEYSPLRKTFPYILIGDEGEFPVDINIAEQLAIEIRKMKASAIIDLSSFKDHEERQEFAGIFINALLDVPKIYRTPLTVIIDEAHNLCRQGESRMASKKPIIALCETGRKRNISTILVTQRLSALDKNASAQMVNRLIGFTVELIDRTAAAKLLGDPDFANEMKDFDGGEYFAFGSALSEKEVLKFKVTEDPDFVKPDLINIPQLSPTGIQISQDISERINSTTQRVETLQEPIQFQNLEKSHDALAKEETPEEMIETLDKPQSEYFDPVARPKEENIVDSLPDEGKIHLTQTQLIKLKKEFRNQGWNEAFEYIIAASKVRKKGLIRKKKIDILDIVRETTSNGMKKFTITGMQERCGDCGVVLESHERAICKKCIYKHTSSSSKQLERAEDEKKFTDRFWKDRQ